jgi:hypothetical protein
MLASCGSDSTAEDASAPVVSTAAPRLEAVDGVEFSDPEGDYTITIGSEWVPSPVGAVEDGVESWVVVPEIIGRHALSIEQFAHFEDSMNRAQHVTGVSGFGNRVHVSDREPDTGCGCVD